MVRRQAILEAAMDLMGSRGFRGMSFAALAEAVGLTEAGVLHYFRSKEELLVAVLEEHRRRELPIVSEWADLGGLRAIELLPCLAQQIIDRPALPCLYQVLMAEHLDDVGDVHDWFVERLEGVRRLFSRVLAQGVAQGELRADIDVDRKAAEIVAFLNAPNAYWRSSRRYMALRYASLEG